MRLSMPDSWLSIGELARRAGVSAQAIRHYERIGLLPAPERGENGYRRYRREDVQRLLLVQAVRSLGAPLRLAAPVVRHAASALCAEVHRDLLALARRQVAALDAEIAALHRLRDHAEAFAGALERLTITSTVSFVACDAVECVTQPTLCLVPKEDLMTTTTDPCCDGCDCTDCCPCDCGCCHSA